MRLRIFVTLVLIALLANAYSAATVARRQNPAAGSTDPISGEWDASFEAMGTTTPATFEFKLDGNKVTGKANSDHTGPGTVSKGSWVENKLSFTLDFAAHESIEVTGTLKDGKLSGEFRTEGFVSKWEARKKSATTGVSATPAVVSPSADPISGEWDATFESRGTKVPITFKFKVDGDKITGTSESAHLGSGTISKGTWTANKLSFTLESGQFSIAVTGLMRDGKLVGEFDAGNAMKGKWEAQRKG